MFGVSLSLFETHQNKQTEQLNPEPALKPAAPTKKKTLDVALDKLKKYGLSSEEDLFKFKHSAVLLLIKRTK